MSDRLDFEFFICVFLAPMTASSFRQFIFFLLVVVFFSCQEKHSDDNLSIFRYNESAGINSLDPAFAKDQG